MRASHMSFTLSKLKPVACAVLLSCTILPAGLSAETLVSPAHAQVQQPAIDLDTALQYYKLNQWMPALLGFQMLADNGDPVAQAHIGIMYRQGLGIEKNLAEAQRWLKMGADNGNALAQHELGWMYARAEITDKRDFESAVRYWKAAAEGGRSSAQLDLAVMYWRGEGVPKDIVMAYTWLKLADQDKDLAGMVETNMIGLRKQMSPEQIEEADKLARGLMEEIEQRS